MSALPQREPLTTHMPKGWVAPAPESANRTLTMVIGYLLVTTLAIPLIRYISLPTVQVSQQIMGYLLLCICIYPVVSHFSKRVPGLPVFPMICLVYGASYAVPVFVGRPIINVLSHVGFVRISNADTNRAIRLAILGVVSMQFGFTFFRYSVLNLFIPRLRLDLASDKAKNRMAYMGLVGVIFIWMWMNGRVVLTGGLMSIMIAASHVPTLCAGYLYWLYLQKERKGMWTTMLWLILLGDVGIGLSMGNVRNAIDPLITIGAVYWMVKKQINWRYAIFGLVFFLAMQSVKGEFRKLVWKQGEAKNSVMDRLLIWKSLLGGEESHGMIISNDQKEQTIKASISRADLIHLFAHAIHMTPKFVPYQYGDTYSYLIYGWVPRLFWPNKPTAQAANQFFGVAYDLQDENSVSSTSIGLPHLVEAFINFGNLGVIFIMMLLGMFYAMLDRLFNHPEAGGGGIAIYATFLMNFMNIETATAATFGALPQSLLIFYFLLRTMRNKRPRVL